MPNSRARTNNSSKTSEKRQTSSVTTETVSLLEQPKKRATKKVAAVEPQVENVESEAPSSDNRLQVLQKVPLTSRKQTALQALGTSANESVALVSDFSERQQNKVSRSLLPAEQTTVAKDEEVEVEKNKKRKRVLPTPTSGLTATHEEKSNSDDDELLTPSSKRCCKSDLKRCLRAGDLIENSRVPEHILKQRNGGKKLLAQFDGQNFIDMQTEKSYRSITNWIKERMMDMGKISTTSNISGWDYAIVHRDGRTTTLRLLVEETKQKADQMRVAMKEQREGTFTSPMLSTMFNDSSSGTLGSSSSNILYNKPQTQLKPTFGMSNLLATPAEVSSEAALHQRLMDLRNQVAEVEHHLYVTRNFAK